MLFIDGDTYTMDFTYFQNVLPNSVYAYYDYAMFGFPIPGQPLYTGSKEQKSKRIRQSDRKVFFMREKNIPIWNGEFGPVYADEHTDPEAVKTNNARYHMLQDQLEIYARGQVSWSIWLYKDIGYQGMMYVSPDMPYMKLIAPFVATKQNLALDF
jgi:hypothetical protein